jgi:hypothetical protein
VLLFCIRKAEVTKRFGIASSFRHEAQRPATLELCQN